MKFMKWTGLYCICNKQTIESLKCVLLQSCVTRNEMDAKVSDYIRQAETINLTSDLNPFVAFRVENTQLNEALSTFGRLASRYPGHFADPNKPSVCLPQAFEEEEEMRIGSSTHSSVFNRVKTTSSCPCNDPTLKQWLSSTEHKCKRKYSLDSISDMNILKEEEDSVGETEEETSVASQNNYFWLNKLSEKGSVQQYNFDFNTSHSAVRVPRYRPDSTMVRTWLELRDGQQHLTEPASYHRDVHRYNNTFKSSDYSNKSISDSFDVLTNSSQNISSLKDWLFCDPAELRDMPGLSTNLHRNVINNIGSTNEYNNHQMNYSWLIPENVTLSIDTKMSTLSVDSSKADNLTKKTNSLLLPDDLFKTGPIDLSRWLLKKSDNQLSVEQNQSVYDENDSTFQTNDEITTLNDVKQKVKATDQSNVIVQSCPKFGICQGGPGGPTCCGGGCPLTSLMNLSKDSTNPSLQQQQQPTMSSHDTTTSVVNASNEVNSLMCNNMSSVVNELIRIAQTDLKQWI
ncbi:ATPase [Schistosoma japonicum]|nr:ATPase [Schistosoma japonicum]